MRNTRKLNRAQKGCQTRRRNKEHVQRAIGAVEAYLDAAEEAAKTGAWDEAVRIDEATEKFLDKTADTNVPTKELPEVSGSSSQPPKCTMVGVVELGGEARVAITVTAAASGMNTIAMTLPEAKMMHKSLSDWINFVEAVSSGRA